MSSIYNVLSLIFRILERSDWLLGAGVGLVSTTHQSTEHSREEEDGAEGPS
jgi:hypothetical protein